MIKVFHTDDHPAFRAGVRVVLERHDDIVVVGEARTGEDTLDAIVESNADVLLLDMELPGISGLEVAQTIQKRGDDVIVLPLSGFTESEFVLGCLDAGTAGYMSKDAPIATIVEAVRTVARGGIYISPQTAVDIVEERRREVHGQAHLREVARDLVDRGFSPRLFQILKLVAQGLNNAEIGEREFRSEHTVRNQVEQIKAALDIGFRPALVAWAWRNSINDIDDELFEAIYERV